MSAVEWSSIAGAYSWIWIGTFLFMAALSGPINYPIRRWFEARMLPCAQQIVLRNSGKEKIETLSEAEKAKVETERKEIKAHFDMESAPLIGILERIVYVFGVMFGGAFALISGWLVMKAFSTWVEGLEASKTEAGKANRMVYYHLYLFGNLLSLIAGLALGFIGLKLAAYCSAVKT